MEAIPELLILGVVGFRPNFRTDPVHLGDISMNLAASIRRAPARLTLLILSATCVLLAAGQGKAGEARAPAGPRGVEEDPIEDNAARMLREGRHTFRFDTFGDEDFWGRQLRLHEAVAGQALGGVGAGLSPAAALALGLKVDVEALPAELQRGLAAGQVNLNDAAVTIALLELNAVVGLTGFVDDRGGLASIGIQCALCHSAVDDSLAPGIGRRLDGWANRDLDVGAIVNLAPDLTAIADLLEVSQDTVRRVLLSWGPGKFDAALLLDGKAFAPDGSSAATLIPPAFGLAGVNLHTSTGWGGVSHWNAFVANIEMHGKGTFFDPRLDDPVQFPVAAKAGFGHIQNDPDLVTSKLPALQFYQLAIPAPQPPEGSFDPAAARLGQALFVGRAGCSACHVPPLFTEPGWNLHTAEEIGIDSFQADRSPDKRYRTAPLKGLWSHSKGGYYHDGRFGSLHEVVAHYERTFQLGLANTEQEQLVQYLLSL
jgi:mono/diheme cytochrome c family protein